jgi:hypothetical protein
MNLTTKQKKAVEFVAEDRVHIHYRTDDIVVATVLGQTGLYRTSIDPAGGSCSCTAGQHHRACSHLLALEIELHRRND